MGFINGMKTVHGGVIINTGIPELPQVEVNSHTFHNPYCDIISYYYYSGSLSEKVCISYCKDITTDDVVVVTSFFKGINDLSSYSSRRYRLGVDKIPKKYARIIELMATAHNMIDFNAFTTRP